MIDFVMSDAFLSSSLFNEIFLVSQHDQQQNYFEATETHFVFYFP